MSAERSSTSGLAKWRVQRANGEVSEPERLDPLERARRNPKSLRLAVTARCYDCVGGANADNGPHRAVRACPSTGCPLYQLRPWQR